MKHRVSCAPGVSKIDGSCYTTVDVRTMVDGWNRRHPDDKITGGRKAAVLALRKRFADCCEDERCWMRTLMHPALAETVRMRTFAPNAPSAWSSDIKTWLRSTDISAVMRRVELMTPEFEFLGPSPIDFDTRAGADCVWPTICNYEIARSIRKNKSKTGFVLNLDDHTGEGTHWVALWLHPSAGQLSYFDSLGDPPPAEVKALAERITQQGADLGRSLKLTWNKIKHQKRNTECGIYAIHFLTELALGSTELNRFLDGPRITDKEMSAKRRSFFNVEKR